MKITIEYESEMEKQTVDFSELSIINLNSGNATRLEFSVITDSTIKVYDTDNKLVFMTTKV